MTVTVTTTGIGEVQQRLEALAEAARTNKVLRRGVSAAVAIIASEQKRRAPVRKLRIQKRKLVKRLKRLKGKRDTLENVAKARKRSSVVQKKFRSLNLVDGTRAQGPRQLIPPGQLQRSIGYRVKVLKSGVMAKAGINVGKKKASEKYAHHGVIVGSFKHKKRETRSGANRGIMPDNAFVLAAANAVSRMASEHLEAAVRADMHRIALGGSV